ncbi:MAG: response regulator [Candidatus Paceibacterota bacterium]
MKRTSKKSRTILVLEDEQSLLGVIKAKLEKEGIRVLTSRSVEKAFSADLKKSKSGGVTLSSVKTALKHVEDLEQVDAIWLDHNLVGEENGLDFVTKFKRNGGHWSKIPIFVVSNTADPDLVKTYIRLGVNKYYVKAENRLDTIVADIHSSLSHA